LPGLIRLLHRALPSFLGISSFAIVT
jgi:hypothetical protein